MWGIITTGIGLYFIITSIQKMRENGMRFGSWITMLLGISFLFRLGLFSKVIFSFFNIALVIAIIGLVVAFGSSLKKTNNTKKYKNIYKSNYEYSNFTNKDGNNSSNDKTEDTSDPFSYRKKDNDFVDVEYEDWEPETSKKKRVTAA